MTRQEMFTKVWQEIHKQGRPAMEDGVCRYRTRGGLKCAAGHLLTDEDFNRMVPNDHESKHLNECSLLGISLGTLPTWVVANLSFVAALQQAHDDAANIAHIHGAFKFLPTFRELMQLIAERHNLTVPE